MARSTDGRRDSLALAPLPARGLARVVGLWLLVVAAAAFSLRAADAVPRTALGLPRGTTRTPDVLTLERISGRRMPVPGYYPDVIEWPPAELRYHADGSAAIWCRQRPSGGVALIIATAPPGVKEIAGAVLPASTELQREALSLGNRRAVVSRARDAEGVVWQQVQWPGPGQVILVRYRGTLDELLKIAGSVHE